MPPGNDRNLKKRGKATPPNPPGDLTQLRTDLAGLERLHAMQSLLIHEIRRQVNEIQAARAE